jgi:hypothetical protein
LLALAYPLLRAARFGVGENPEFKQLEEDRKLKREKKKLDGERKLYVQPSNVLNHICLKR